MPAELRPRRDGQVVGELLDGVRAAGRVGDGWRRATPRRAGHWCCGRSCGRMLRTRRRARRTGARSRRRHRRRPQRRRRRWCAACSRRGRTYWSSGGWSPRGSAVAGRAAAELGHPRPEPARRAELRDRRELLVGGSEPELDEAEALLRRRCRRPRACAAGGAPGEQPAELLDRRRRPPRARSSRRRPRPARPPRSPSRAKAASSAASEDRGCCRGAAGRVATRLGLPRVGDSSTTGARSSRTPSRPRRGRPRPPAQPEAGGAGLEVGDGAALSARRRGPG